MKRGSWWARAARGWMCLAMGLTLWGLVSAQSVSKTLAASALQQAATHAMAGKRGATVVIDVATGKVLAAYHLDVAARRLALPGSAIKPFTLLTLLEAGKVDQQTVLMCQRPLTIGGHRLDCTH